MCFFLHFCAVRLMDEVCVSCGSLELLGGYDFQVLFKNLYMLFTGIACRAPPPEWNCPEEEAYDKGVP